VTAATWLRHSVTRRVCERSRVLREYMDDHGEHKAKEAERASWGEVLGVVTELPYPYDRDHEYPTLLDYLGSV
jgi:hypothetical protein